MQPLSGYCRHLPHSTNYYKSIIKPEAYLRHQKCLEDMQKKLQQELKNETVRKIMGNGCV